MLLINACGFYVDEIVFCILNEIVFCMSVRLFYVVRVCFVC